MSCFQAIPEASMVAPDSLTDYVEEEGKNG